MDCILTVRREAELEWLPGLSWAGGGLAFPTVNSPGSPECICLGSFTHFSQLLANEQRRNIAGETPVYLLELCCCGFVLEHFGLETFTGNPLHKTDQEASSDEAGDGWLVPNKILFQFTPHPRAP